MTYQVIDPDADPLVGTTLERWLDDTAGRSFFLYFHTMDAHGPYDPPRAYHRELPTPGTPVPADPIFDPPWLEQPTAESRRMRYEGEIAYGDEHLGRFVDMFRARGLWENTLFVFVFVSDHGEFMGEHGRWGHHSPPYTQVTHIPLVMVAPGLLPAGLAIEENVQILDVMPTVLDVVGLPHPVALTQGESVLPLLAGDARRFTERFVYMESERPGLAAFNYGAFAFIPEKNFIFDRRRDFDQTRYVNGFVLDFGLKARARRLSRLYHETYARVAAAMAAPDPSAVEMDSETIEQLRALGYID